MLMKVTRPCFSLAPLAVAKHKCPSPKCHKSFFPLPLFFAQHLLSPSGLSPCAKVSTGTKFLQEINFGGLGGLIIRSRRLIVLCFRRERLLERGAAALNQFHGLFITDEITPTFSIQFYSVIWICSSEWADGREKPCWEGTRTQCSPFFCQSPMGNVKPHTWTLRECRRGLRHWIFSALMKERRRGTWTGRGRNSESCKRHIEEHWWWVHPYSFSTSMNWVQVQS